MTVIKKTGDSGFDIEKCVFLLHTHLMMQSTYDRLRYNLVVKEVMASVESQKPVEYRYNSKAYYGFSDKVWLHCCAKHCSETNICRVKIPEPLYISNPGILFMEAPPDLNRE